MLIIETLFKTYGFQFASVIALISFFATRYFTIRDKKREMKHNLFQKMKVEAINNFIECYTNSELRWFQLPYYDIISHKYTGKDVDDIVIPIHNAFTSSFYKLNLILDDSEIQEFGEMYKSINKIKNLLGRLLFDYDETKLVQKVNEYVDTVDRVKDENRLLLQTIGRKFRLNYQ